MDCSSTSTSQQPLQDLTEALDDLAIHESPSSPPQRPLQDVYEELFHEYQSLEHEPLKAAAERLLVLPREIRDEIYSYIFHSDDTLTLPYDGLEFYLRAQWVGSQIAAEAAITFYGINKFHVELGTPLADALETCHRGSGVVPLEVIRHLEIDLREDLDIASLPKDDGEPSEDLKLIDKYVLDNGDITDYDAVYEILSDPSEQRAALACLLAMPRLTALSFRVIKSYDAPLELRDINPLIRQLRILRPQIKIEVSVTYDALLKTAWEDWDDEESWLPARHQRYDEIFSMAGFSDVSELIREPSEEDRAHVKEWLPDGKMPNDRKAVQGLLDQTASHRRTLQGEYACQEPQLMRVLLEKHWEVWKKMEAEKQGEKEKFSAESKDAAS